jgi:hypothetical protein
VLCMIKTCPGVKGGVYVDIGETWVRIRVWGLVFAAAATCYPLACVLCSASSAL